MKFKNIVLFFVVTMVFVFNIPAHAQENPYPKLATLLQNYYETSIGLQVEMLQTIYLVSQLVTAEPQVENTKNAANSLNEKVANYEKIAKEINDFMANNESTLAASKEVLEKVEIDTSPETIIKIKQLVNKLNDVSQSLLEIEFTVYANEGWANAGIRVKPNDLILVDSTGGWSVSPRDDMVGWQGYICNSSTSYNINKNAQRGALLYRVRGSSNPNGYSLNEKKMGRIDSKGRLEFVINDSDRRNNSGQLDLKIVVINGDAFEQFIKTTLNLKEEK